MKTLREFEAKFTFDMITYKGKLQSVYNICSLIDYLELNDVDYFESGKIIMDFAKANNLFIYSAPKCMFSTYDAIEGSIAGNYNGVIVEDLS